MTEDWDACSGLVQCYDRDRVVGGRVVSCREGEEIGFSGVRALVLEDE